MNDEPTEPANWSVYLAKRKREGWGSAKPPTTKDYPGHPAVAEADRQRKELQRLKFAAMSAENGTSVSPDGTSPNEALSVQVKGTIKADTVTDFGPVTANPDRRRRGGRLPLAPQERRRRRREKDRERKRRARRARRFARYPFCPAVKRFPQQAS